MIALILLPNASYLQSLTRYILMGYHHCYICIIISSKVHCDGSLDVDAGTICSSPSCCICRSEHRLPPCACSRYATVAEKAVFFFFFAVKNFISMFYYLLQIELIGKISVTVDAKLGLTRFPSLALIASRRHRQGFRLF